VIAPNTANDPVAMSFANMLFLIVPFQLPNLPGACSEVALLIYPAGQETSVDDQGLSGDK
jgi:hypothetical protein